MRECHYAPALPADFLSIPSRHPEPTLNLDKQPYNPYAAPASPVESRGQCYRNGKQVIVPTGATLPHRCVKCNAPAEMDKPKTYSWHHPGYYVLILVGLIFYVIAALIATKKAKVAIGVCQHHRSRRRMFGMIAVTLLILGIVTLFMAVDYEGQGNPLGLVSGLSLFGSLLMASFGTRMLTAASVTREEARLNGCGEEFLASLPQG